MATDKTLPGSYISTIEFTNSYTGIDVSTLQPGQLARAIRRASSWVDRICKQNLFASVDQVTLLEGVYPQGFTFDRKSGYVMLFPNQFPINSVASLTYQYGINPANPTTIDPLFCRIFPRYIMVQTSFVLSHITPWPDPLLLNLSYVNGYAVAQLSSSAAATTSVLNLVPQPGQATVQGFTPGTVIEIQDTSPEIVTVLSTTNNAVTLTAPLASTHAADVMVAPPNFSIPQQACVNLTEYLLKERGVGPLALHDNAFTNNRTNDLPTELLRECEDMLVDFIVNA